MSETELSLRLWAAREVFEPWMSADSSIFCNPRNGLMIVTGFSSRYCSQDAIKLLASDLTSSVSEGNLARPLLLTGLGVTGLADFFDLGGTFGVPWV